MADHGDLVRRAEELHTDMAAAMVAETSELSQHLMQRALPHAMAVHLLLKEALQCRRSSA